MDIKLYGSPSCQWSMDLQKWLKRKRIKFEFLDVMDESKYWDDLLEKTSQLVTPVLEINKEIIIGFHEKKIEAAIAKAKA